MSGWCHQSVVLGIWLALCVLGPPAAQADSPASADRVTSESHVPSGEIALTDVVIPPRRRGDTRYAYYKDLLALALSKTVPDHGQFRIVTWSTQTTQGRAIKELARPDTRLRVVWSGTSLEREELLLPIRVPLAKGLLGLRIGIVRRGDLPLFETVKTLEDLKRLRICQGRHWPDTVVLKRAGLSVVTSPVDHELMGLLDAGQCDIFLRAVYEPFGELEARGKDYPDLVVEPSLMVRYPFATYFFTNRRDAGLAERIETGLRRALADGSFDRQFRDHRVTAGALERAGVAQRHVFELENPLMPPETPIDDGRLWLQIPEML